MKLQQMTSYNLYEGRFTCEALQQESERFRETAGSSECNQHLGFMPAFIDSATGVVYLSRFDSGQLAPCHILDGLPAHLITERNENGKPLAALGTISAGFFKNGYYYTRDAAQKAANGEPLNEALIPSLTVY